MPAKQLFNNSYKFFNETGEITRFPGRFFKESTKRNQEFEEFIRQCYWVGYRLTSGKVSTACRSMREVLI